MDYDDLPVPPSTADGAAASLFSVHEWTPHMGDWQIDLDSVRSEKQR